MLGWVHLTLLSDMAKQNMDVQLNAHKSRMRMLMDNLFGKTEQRSAFNATYINLVD